jgi:mono/diheme cytochrome c family protein
MFATNLKIILVVFGTILAYTLLANSIPQVESEVPEALTMSVDVAPEEIAAAGEQLYFGAGGCTACHGTGTRAPNLATAEGSVGLIGARCGDRVPGMACKDYLHTSLVQPLAYVVEGYQPIMPDMSKTLSPAQLWALVAYMQSLGGEITVTGADVQEPAGGTGGAVAGAPPAAAGPATTATMEPVALMKEQGCLTCHVLGAEGGPIGPPLTTIGATRNAEYIRHSILDPAAEVAPGYEAFAGVMPKTFGNQMSAAQLEALVQYLANQK